MKRGDIVKFKKVVDLGDDRIRMRLLEDPDGGRVEWWKGIGGKSGRINDQSDLYISS